MLEIFLGHLGIICNEPSQVHGVVNAGIVEVQCKLIVLFDPLDDLLQVGDLHAKARFLHAVLEDNAFVTVAA